MQWIWELLISTVKSKALEDKFKPASAIVNEVCVVLTIILFLSSLKFLAAGKKIDMVFVGLGSVRIVEKCDRGHSFSLQGPTLCRQIQLNNIF